MRCDDEASEAGFEQSENMFAFVAAFRFMKTLNSDVVPKRQAAMAMKCVADVDDDEL